MAPASKVNFPANFQVEEGVDLFIYGDYLYWRAAEEGLHLVNKGSATLGTVQKIDPDFDSGFRVGFGLNFPRAGYDLGGYWTSFTTRATNSTQSTSWPLWAEPNVAASSSEKASWHLSMNLADLEWGRASWFGGNFSLRPFFSLRGAFIDQKLSMNFAYETTPSSLGVIHAKSDFSGGGLRAGADGRWTFPYGFALYGQAAGSLLYGQFQTKSTWGLDSQTVACAKNNFLQTLSNMQLALGFGWDTHFYKDQLHIEFHIGWEQALFFHMNRMSHYINQLSKALYFQEQGNLSVQGVTVGGRFDF
ncbi:MAG: hypothetical protein HY069_05205 [Chlamydiia bacterium]|nr:hypothetical protein [Chlamydiia bacterium]